MDFEEHTNRLDGPEFLTELRGEPYPHFFRDFHRLVTTSH